MASPSNEDLTADVIVIGGGPGGSTAATMLARKGIRVLLLERDQFPRDHVGESLLPASIPVLEELGVLPAVQDAGFLPKWGATMVWGREKDPWSWYFKETNPKHPHSYQVLRPEFARLLLENSRANGVTVREGHHVADVLFEDGRATGVRYSTEGVSGRIARASFIVDASGQRGLLGNSFGYDAGTPFSGTWRSTDTSLVPSVCHRPMRQISSLSPIHAGGSGIYRYTQVGQAWELL